MNKEYRILERKRLRPGEEARVYELDNPYEWSEWTLVKSQSSEGGRYYAKISAERAILQLKGWGTRYEKEFKVQSQPLTNNWEDE